VVHPSNNISTLTKRQQEIFRFYDSVYALNKLVNYYNETHYAFLTAVALCTGGQTHHYNSFNLYLYADPISGDLKPFLREVLPFEQKNIQLRYNELKYAFYLANNLSGYAQTSKLFDQKVDEFVQLIQTTDIDKVIQNDKTLSNLYSFVIKNYPWTYVYKNRFRVSLVGFDKVKNRTNFDAQKKLSMISGDVYLKDTSITYSIADSVVFKKGAKIFLTNSTVVFSDLQLNYIDNRSPLVFIGDSLSTLIFDKCHINFARTVFKGFSNHLGSFKKNREVTGAFTFANSEVRLRDVEFSNNYSGDDLVNFYRCKVDIRNSSFHDAKADGIDFDFSFGQFDSSQVYRCGNDGLDLGGSSLVIKNAIVSDCGDKGISIGEASPRVVIEGVKLNLNELGISLKDGSTLSANRIYFQANKVDFVAYAKKAQYQHSALLQSDFDFSKISYLIEPGVLMPTNSRISRTDKVIDLMYGNKYGRKSVR
jgi:hypothetical protein